MKRQRATRKKVHFLPAGPVHLHLYVRNADALVKRAAERVRAAGG